MSGSRVNGGPRPGWRASLGSDGCRSTDRPGWCATSARTTAAATACPFAFPAVTFTGEGAGDGRILVGVAAFGTIGPVDATAVVAGAAAAVRDGFLAAGITATGAGLDVLVAAAAVRPGPCSVETGIVGVGAAGGVGTRSE